ncbi:hypothetical protein COV18_07200 [Candidatus Woesearchaeota archaeon CG10_big_fil_rev_8_21_14_0_10_37_12]|nr:MAG: hypothetical protein COV18_07200 [Candidatus Woesearchaeota archaeon CG10_big_fil_rev_8_21_14_0_10_37_12]
MVDEVLKNIDPEELEQPIEASKWRKPVLLVISLFFIILLGSWSLYATLNPLVSSEKVINNELIFPEARIIFGNNTLAELRNEFLDNQHREIKACLFGSVHDGIYNVVNVEFPEIIRANVVHVVSVSCPDNVLIDLHSHPINECLASEQDVGVYNQLKQRNPQARMMIMCGVNRFALV